MIDSEPYAGVGRSRRGERSDQAAARPQKRGGPEGAADFCRKKDNGTGRTPCRCLRSHAG